ncbi:MAG TPA: hypothetical protein VGF71_16760 [Caulobacteraceae bacterium]
MILENIHHGGPKSRSPELTGYAWKSQLKFAEELGLGDRRVREFQDELESFGFIGVRRRQRKTSLIWLTWPPEGQPKNIHGEGFLTGKRAPVRTGAATSRLSMLERRDCGALTGGRGPTTLRTPIEDLKRKNHALMLMAAHDNLHGTASDTPNRAEDSFLSNGPASPATELNSSRSWDRCDPTDGDNMVSFGNQAKALRNQIRRAATDGALRDIASRSQIARFNVAEQLLLRRHVDERRREFCVGRFDAPFGGVPVATLAAEVAAAHTAVSPGRTGAGVDLFALMDDGMRKLESPVPTDDCSSPVDNRQTQAWLA